MSIMMDLYKDYVLTNTSRQCKAYKNYDKTNVRADPHGVFVAITKMPVAEAGITAIS